MVITYLRLIYWFKRFNFLELYHSKLLFDMLVTIQTSYFID